MGAEHLAVDAEATPMTRAGSSMRSEPLLVVEGLKTHFRLPLGDVKAVDGVDLTVDRGRTLGIVGESGSGKTVLARTIMRLNIGSNVHTEGSVRYAGVDLLDVPKKKMRDYWGVEIAMVFQDPMTSLNPVVKVGRQLTEHLRHHLDLSRNESHETALALLKEVRIPEAEKRLDALPPPAVREACGNAFVSR